MTLTAHHAKRLTKLSVQCHVRENRMPVQIAEERRSGYIPLSLQKNSLSFTHRMAAESEHEARTWQTSENTDGFSPKKRMAGKTLKEWRRTDNVEHCWHKKDTTNG